MKKIFALLLAVCLACSLTACGNITEQVMGQLMSKPEPQTTVAPQSSSAPEDVTSESTPEPTPMETQDPESIPATTQTPSATSEPVKQETSVGEVMDAATSTAQSPVPFNTQATIGKYSVIDEKYHAVNVQITGIISDPATIDSMIQVHNTYASEWRQIDLQSEYYQVPADVQWYAVTYEVQIPEDFPAESWGVYNAEIDWSIENVDGGGIPSKDGTTAYIGLGTAYCDLYSENFNDDMDYMPGNTYSFAGLFPMVQGFENYVFNVNYVPVGLTSDDGQLVDAFFAAS